MHPLLRSLPVLSLILSAPAAPAKPPLAASLLTSGTAVILSPPNGATVSVGAPVSFQSQFLYGTTNAVTTPDYYLWDFGDGSTQTVVEAQTSHAYAAAGTYTVKVTAYRENRFNVLVPSTTASLSLGVLGPPVISAQPVNQGVSMPAPATFSVTAAGGSLGYQWMKNGSPIPGATGPQYTTPPTVAQDHGSTFSVTVSNPSGRVTSSPAVLTVSQDAAYRYDASGNLLSDGSRAFEWDEASRLHAITLGTHRTEFQYDGFGRRAVVVEYENGVVQGIRKLLWEGPEPIEELDANGVTTLRRFFNQGFLEGSDSFYYTRDHLGSVRELTDASGQVRARYDYDPYGRRTKVAGDKESPIGFTGDFRHAQTGLDLTLFRAYDPDLGRWLSRDPIGVGDGPNESLYVHNSPITSKDAYGLSGPRIGFKIWKPMNDGDIGGTIECKNQRLQPIIRKDLPPELAMGALLHELSHVYDFPTNTCVGQLDGHNGLVNSPVFITSNDNTWDNCLTEIKAYNAELDYFMGLLTSASCGDKCQATSEQRVKDIVRILEDGWQHCINKKPFYGK